jgi:hypothetical protein
MACLVLSLVGYLWHSRHQPHLNSAAQNSAFLPPVEPPADSSGSLTRASFRQAPLGLARRSGAKIGLNAADLYKNAYTLFQALSEYERMLLFKNEHWLHAGGPASDAEAPELPVGLEDVLEAKLHGIMMLLRQADQEAGYCDWGTGAMPLDASSPHLEIVNALVSVVHWQAERKAQQSPAAAVADIGLAIRLARLESNAAPAGFSTAANLTHASLVALCLEAGNLHSDSTTGEAVALLQSLDPRADFAQALENGARDLRALSARLQAVTEPREARRLLTEAMPSYGGQQLPTDADLLTFPAQVERLTAIEHQLAQKALAPASEWETWWSSVEAEAKRSHLLEAYVGQLQAARGWLRISLVTQAMAQQGWEILQAGENQPAIILDPATGRPFVVNRGDAQMLLTSEQNFRGRPLQMIFFGAAQPASPATEGSASTTTEGTPAAVGTATNATATESQISSPEAAAAPVSANLGN